jgi:hypothetical protein
MRIDTKIVITIGILLTYIVLIRPLVKEQRYGYIKKIANLEKEPFELISTDVVPSDPEANNANIAYKTILLYLQKNPSKSYKFIEDLQKRFFNPSCAVKSPINFNELADARILVF